MNAHDAVGIPGLQAGEDVKSPFFLTHHAARPEDGAYVGRFHADVQREVFDLLGERAEFIGERRRIPPRSRGTGPAALVVPAGELRTCRALVVLYSDEYLRSAECGREWALFRERQRWFTQLTGRRSEALIGVRWSVAGNWLPGPGACELYAEGLGDAYRDGGIFEVMRTDPTVHDYRVIVRRVAERLVRAEESLPVLSESDARFVALPEGVPADLVRWNPVRRPFDRGPRVRTPARQPRAAVPAGARASRQLGDQLGERFGVGADDTPDDTQAEKSAGRGAWLTDLRGSRRPILTWSPGRDVGEGR